jgi:hypothetical protein
MSIPVSMRSPMRTDPRGTGSPYGTSPYGTNTFVSTLGHMYVILVVFDNTHTRVRRAALEPPRGHRAREHPRQHRGVTTGQRQQTGARVCVPMRVYNFVCVCVRMRMCTCACLCVCTPSNKCFLSAGLGTVHGSRHACEGRPRGFGCCARGPPPGAARTHTPSFLLCPSPPPPPTHTMVLTPCTRLAVVGGWRGLRGCPAAACGTACGTAGVAGRERTAGGRG